MVAYGQREGFLTDYSGVRMFPSTDKFYVVALGVGGISGMEVKFIAIGEYLRTEMLMARSNPGLLGHEVEGKTVNHLSIFKNIKGLVL